MHGSNRIDFSMDPDAWHEIEIKKIIFFFIDREKGEKRRRKLLS